MTGLSPRDEVFLAEMGIAPLWTLRAPPSAAPVEEAPAGAGVVLEEAPAAAVPSQPAVAVAQADPARDDVAAPVAAGPKGIADMDWDELREAVARCSACSACKDGRKPVFGTGARQARWFVAAGASTAADEQAAQPLAGDTGKLLDNMLFAVGLSRTDDVYVTNLIKCRPLSAKGGDRAPTVEEAAACRPFLQRELALTGADTVLTLGQIAANGLLGKPLAEPLAGARGTTHQLDGVPLVATLHPGELLRRGADKALAWADLCRARAARARPG